MKYAYRILHSLCKKKNDDMPGNCTRLCEMSNVSRPGDIFYTFALDVN